MSNERKELRAEKPKKGDTHTFMRVSETGSHSSAVTVVFDGKEWVYTELDEIIAEDLRYDKSAEKW